MKRFAADIPKRLNVGLTCGKPVSADRANSFMKPARDISAQAYLGRVRFDELAANIIMCNRPSIIGVLKS
jgi:hypothetical protein